MTYDLVPHIDPQGRTIWMEPNNVYGQRFRVARGLGDAASFTNSANSAANLLDNISSKIGSGGGGSQTDAGKIAGVYVQMGTLTVTVAPLFGPAAPLVAAAGAAVVAAAKLVNLIAGTSMAKQQREQAGQYEEANAQIRLQIDSVSYQNNATSQALNDLGIALKQVGFGGLGNLWEDVFTPSAVKEAQNRLDSAQQENGLLKNVLDQQISQLKSKIDQFDKLLSAITIEGQNKKLITTVAIWSLATITAAGLGWLGYNYFKKKSRKS